MMKSMRDMIKSIIYMIFYHKTIVRERDKACNDLIAYIDDAILSIKSIFSSLTFIDPNTEIVWRNQHIDILTASELSNIQKLSKADNYKRLHAKQKELFDAVGVFSLKIQKHNEMVLNTKIRMAYTLIEDVEGRKLDR